MSARSVKLLDRINNPGRIITGSFYRTYHVIGFLPVCLMMFVQKKPLICYSFACPVLFRISSNFFSSNDWPSMWFPIVSVFQNF